MRKIIVTVLFALCLLCSVSNSVSAKRKLSTSQQRNADIIADIVSENWEKYGCLPSVAVAQAFVESTLGDHKPNPGNLWGITVSSGLKYYDSVEDGTYGYMRTINNGYYGSAPFDEDYSSQIYKILAGGYCVPVGSYYENVIWAIETYGFDEYDKKMFNSIEEKEKKEKERQRKIKEQKEKEKKEKIAREIEETEFEVIYDSNLLPSEMSIGGYDDIDEGCITITTHFIESDVLETMIPHPLITAPIQHYDIKKRQEYDFKPKKGILITGDLSLINKRLKVKWEYLAVG